MEGGIITSMEFDGNFANDTELQIIQLLQTEEGRKVLKKAIDHIRANKEETK